MPASWWVHLNLGPGIAVSFLETIKYDIYHVYAFIVESSKVIMRYLLHLQKSDVCTMHTRPFCFSLAQYCFYTNQNRDSRKKSAVGSCQFSEESVNQFILVFSIMIARREKTTFFFGGGLHGIAHQLH